MYRGVDWRDVAEAHRRAAMTPGHGALTANVSAAPPFHREDLPALWDDPWTVIARRVPGVRAAFEARRWPLPPRIDRVYPIATAARTLGYRPRYSIGRLLGIADR